MDDGNGITGLNPGKAQSDIKRINEAVVALYNDLNSAGLEFYTALSKLWYSPKAIQFYTDTAVTISALADEISSFGKSTVNDCVSAFNSIAAAHGTSRIGISAGPFSPVDTYGTMLDIGPSGEVGMEVDQVKTVTAEFVNHMNKISSNLAGVPRSIAFFDTDGALVRSCNTRVDQLTGKVEGAAHSIISAVSSAIVEETSRVEQGAQTAASAISG